MTPEQADAYTAGHVARITRWIWLDRGELGLDLGCGIGRLTNPVAACFAGATMIGLDASPRMVSHALSMRTSRNVEFLRGEGALPPYLFGGWWSVLLFQHLPPEECEAYLRLLARSTRLLGRGIFQYVEGDEVGPTSYQARRGQVEGWCQSAGLEVVAIDGDDNYSPDWRWVRVVTK